MVAGIIFVIGGILQTATNGKEMMMAGRFIGGIGIGQMVGRPLIYNHTLLMNSQGVLVPRKLHS
jgi:hypothetical protein